MSSPRVLLMTLSIRTAASGRSYLSGFLGKARVVAFAGEPDRFGNPTWDILLASLSRGRRRPAPHLTQPTETAASPMPPASADRPRGSTHAERAPRPGRSASPARSSIDMARSMSAATTFRFEWSRP